MAGKCQRLPSVPGKDVFVSYGREEDVKKFVRKLKIDLETKEISVWLDEVDIPTGTEWPKEIGIALRDCKAMIAVVTKKYVSSQYCKSELYVARDYKKKIFPIIREEGWDESDEAEGVKFMIAASNWAMFRPVDDYGVSLQRLVEGLKGMETGQVETDIGKGQDPMDSLTGQPRSPNSELHTQTSAVPTPPTELLDELRPTPTVSCPTADHKCDTNTQPKKKKCNIDPKCKKFVSLIINLNNILGGDPESAASVLGKMKLSLAILKGLDDSVAIDSEVYHGANTVIDFFAVMSKYWNCYADHDLLEMVIDATGNKDAIDALHYFLRSRDAEMVIPVTKCPEVPFKSACSDSATDSTRTSKGEGESPQQSHQENKHASRLEGNQQIVCSTSQKKGCKIPNNCSSENSCTFPQCADTNEMNSTSPANTSPQPPADTSPQPPAGTSRQSPIDTSQHNHKDGQFSAETSTTRQGSCSIDSAISHQPRLSVPDPESSEAIEDLQRLHHHPGCDHELPPNRVPVIAEVNFNSITCGWYNCLKEVVSSVFGTPKEAMSLQGVYKGSCILVWHVSEGIATWIQRVRLLPDNQQMLLECMVMKLSCGDVCLFNVPREELQEMVESGMIPESEAVSEIEVAEGGEMEPEVEGRVRSITSDAEFQRALKQAGETLVVVDFTADWCPPSVQMNPVFAALSEQYTEAEFLSVDSDECEESAYKYNVDAVPMFAFFRMGRLLHQFSGARPEELEAKIKHFLLGSGAWFPGKGHSLLPKEDPDTEGATPGGGREGEGKERLKGVGEQERKKREPGGERPAGGERKPSEETERGGEKDPHRERERSGERERSPEKEGGGASGSRGEQDQGGKKEEVGEEREGGEETAVERKRGEEQPHPIIVDPALPTTSVQIRLADGSRLVEKFNHSHTVGDIHHAISRSRPSQAATCYILMTAFPKRELTDHKQTLASANLLNAVIIQKITD